MPKLSFRDGWQNATAPAMGTTEYIAPEQLRSNHGRPSADIYSLGAMLYEILTGTSPFPGDDPTNTGSQRLTGDPVWADEMELSLYNAMVGAMTPDGEWFSYFTQLTGERVPSFIAHADLNLSCCVASGPRGLLLTPRWAVMTARDGPVVNLYAPGTATLPEDLT